MIVLLDMEYMKDDNAIVEDSTSDTVFIRISVHELKNQVNL